MAQDRGERPQAAAYDASPTATGPDREVGWYQHPTRPREHRFWDGRRWTDWSKGADAGEAPVVPRPRGTSG